MGSSASMNTSLDFRCIGFYQKIKDFNGLPANVGNTVICFETQSSWQLRDDGARYDLHTLIMPNGPQGIPGEPGPQGIPGKDMKFEDLDDAQIGFLVKSIMDLIRIPEDGKSVSIEEVIATLKGDPEFISSVTGKKGLDGKDGKDGADGKDGINGVNGSNGKDGKDGDRGIQGVKGESFKLSDLSEDEYNKLIRDIVKETIPSLPRGPQGNPFRYEDFTPDQLARLRGNIQNIVDQILSKLDISPIVEYSPDGENDFTTSWKRTDKFFRITIGGKKLEVLPIN